LASAGAVARASTDDDSGAGVFGGADRLSHTGCQPSGSWSNEPPGASSADTSAAGSRTSSTRALAETRFGSGFGSGVAAIFGPSAWAWIGGPAVAMSVTWTSSRNRGLRLTPKTRLVS
jgi:hypothetical protein